MRLVRGSGVSLRQEPAAPSPALLRASQSQSHRIDLSPANGRASSPNGRPASRPRCNLPPIRHSHSERSVAVVCCRRLKSRYRSVDAPGALTASTVLPHLHADTGPPADEAAFIAAPVVHDRMPDRGATTACSPKSTFTAMTRRRARVDPPIFANPAVAPVQPLHACSTEAPSQTNALPSPRPSTRP